MFIIYSPDTDGGNVYGARGGKFEGT